MKANELAKALMCHVMRHGDCDVEISVLKPKIGKKDPFKDQGYLASEPTRVVYEDNGKGGKWVSIRDWPY